MAKLLEIYAEKLKKGQEQFTGEIPKEYRGDLTTVKALNAFGLIIFKMRKRAIKKVRAKNPADNGVLEKIRLNSIAKMLSSEKKIDVVKKPIKEEKKVELVFA
jgi:hypothetical protein